MKPFSSAPELFTFGVTAAGDFCYIAEEHTRTETTLNYFEARDIATDHMRILQVKYARVIPNEFREFWGLDPVIIPLFRG